MTLFKLEVYTPYSRFFSDEIEALTLTLSDGEITVYANHSMFTAPVRAGRMRIKNRKGEWKEAFVAEGILEVKQHNTILMADAAEWPEDINVERARAAKKRASEQIDSSTFSFESNTAFAALKRAEWRITISGGDISSSG